MKKSFLLITVSTLILQSCFVSNTTKLKGHKPVFGKSFFNENQNENSEQVYQEQISRSVTKHETLSELSIENPEITDLATTENEIIDLPKQKNYLLDTGCDKITFLNGNEEEVKLMEIGDDYVKYKQCDNLEGPTFTISKSKLFMIVYSNGNKEVIEHEEVKESQNEYKPNINNRNNYSSEPEVNGFAIASLVLGILGFIPLAGIVFGAIALEKIKKQPERYKGKGIATAGFILSLAWLFILLLILL